MKIFSFFIFASLFLFAGLIQAQNKPVVKQQYNIEDHENGVSSLKEAYLKYTQEKKQLNTYKKDNFEAAKVKLSVDDLESRQAAAESKFKLPSIEDIRMKENREKYLNGSKGLSKRTTISAISDNIIYFPDENLRNRICESLFCTPEELTESKLAELYYLYAFNLNITDLTGIEYCINLQYLDLSNNNISDFSRVSQLTNLQEFGIANNGTLINDFSFLYDLPNLISLYIFNNNISDISFLTELPGLQALSIGNNPIMDFSPIRSLSNLQEFYAQGTSLQDLSFLSPDLNMRRMDINLNQITDISVLSNYSNLISLALVGNPITDISPLNNLTALEFLDLSEINLSSSASQLLSNKTNLTFLLLRRTNITDINFISGLTNLIILYMGDNQVNNFEPLLNLTNLEVLNIGYTGISDLTVFTGMPNLRDFMVYNNNIRDISPLFNMPGLRLVNLWDNPISNKTILVDIPLLKNNGVNVEHWGTRGLAVIEPNQQSELIIGNSFNIKWKNEDCQWSCSGGAVWVNIDLSTDGGSSWTSIVRNTENDGEYGWVVPDIQSTNCLIKISDAEVPADIFTISPNPFSIPQQSVVVQFPDPVLEAKIREALGGYQGDLTSIKLKEITNIWAGFAGITNLSGLEYCTNLEWLDLYGNQVTDITPLAGLELLIGLNITANPIQDFTPLASLTNMWSLYCVGLNISDISFVNNMPALRDLELGNNPISDFSPLYNLHNIFGLDLNNTGVSDISFVAGMPNIYYLSIGSNNITDISVLQNLPGLQKLKISYNPVSNINIISNLVNLEELELAGMGLGDISFLQGLVNLRWLFLVQNNISDISALSNLTGLELLDLTFNPISDFTPLGNLVNMRSLTLQSTGISDLSVLQPMQQMQALVLGMNPVRDISQLLNFPALRFVELYELPLSNKAILIDIPDLINKGVMVMNSPQIRQLTVIAPNQAEDLTAGGQFEIKWKNADCEFNCGSGALNVNIDLSTDAGNTWINVVQETPNDSLYEWTIPDVESENCLIRVTDSEVPDQVVDISDGVFSIKAPPAALENLTVLLAEMKAFNNFPDNKAKKDLEKVIKSVEKSLNSSLWADENHLDSKHGNKVFGEHEDAVKDLKKIIKEYIGDISLASKIWIDGLTGVDLLIVTTSFSDAAAALDSMGCDDNPEQTDCEKAYKEFDKAQKDYDKAMEELASGDNSRAIHYLGKSWEELQDGLKKILSKNTPDNLALFGIPESFELLQNYPNPFNPSTVIRFGLPANSLVTIRVYNMLGEEVALLVNGFFEAGYHETEFAAENFASGLFIYRIETASETGDKFVKSQKMMLMK